MSVHVLRCPNCSANLEVVDGSQLVRCRFCAARCRVEGFGSAATLSAEQEAAWNELVEEVKGIDLDAIQENLAHMQQVYEEKQKSEVWEALTEALVGHEDLDPLARSIVEAGNGKFFLTQLDQMPMKGGTEYKAVRQVMDRLATKVAILMANRAEAGVQESSEATLAARLAAAREIRQLTEEAEKAKRDLALVQEAERLATEAEKRIAFRNSPAERAKIRAAEEVLARAEAEQATATLSRIRSEASQQEVDRAAALALRSQYRMSRVWAIAAFPAVMVCVGAAGVGLAAWNPAGWVMTLGRLLIWGSPFVALYSSSMKWGKGTEAGRKFNEVAPWFGLPEVAVKSKSQQGASGCTHETVGGCGCVAFLALAVGLWALAYFGSDPATTNTPSPEANSDPTPQSNSRAPSDSPAGNAAPPADGESPPANNAPRSD